MPDPFVGSARFKRVSDAPELRRKARECRRLANGADERTAAHLLMLAAAFEADADELDPPATAPTSRPGGPERQGRA